MVKSVKEFSHPILTVTSFGCFLLWINNNVTATKPATINPVSSYIDKFIAAENPITLQIRGIINRKTGTLLFANSSIPKVKIVVGHGSPKVGE